MNRKNDNFFFIIKLLIAGIFLFAGISKLINPLAFVDSIDNYRLLPYLFVTFFAIVLPWVEILGAVFILIGKWNKGAALILVMLSFVFLIAVGSALFRGLDISCGCFIAGENATKIGITKLIENIFLLGMTVGYYLKVINEFSLKSLKKL